MRTVLKWAFVLVVFVAGAFITAMAAKSVGLSSDAAGPVCMLGGCMSMLAALWLGDEVFP